ncbi:hypothetical protein LIER_08848 [Lithospermum erythrorhizon]|uniref:Uncharacterized protein n=1 Tax=Lithospermum erythrorhizon TaxID=34254 RepID=A0AAV3PF60_LITER
MLKALVMKLAGMIPVESIPPLAANHASAGSSIATGLLVQMERIHTPVQFTPPQPLPYPETQMWTHIPPSPQPQETPSQTQATPDDITRLDM